MPRIFFLIYCQHIFFSCRQKKKFLLREFSYFSLAVRKKYIAARKKVLSHIRIRRKKWRYQKTLLLVSVFYGLGEFNLWNND